MYTVQVTGGATPGIYDFTHGTLEYYVGGEGPYIEAIAGGAEAEVMTETPPQPVRGSAYPINKLIMLLPWTALAVAPAAGITILARRRRTQS